MNKPSNKGNSRISVVEETEGGLWVWELPEGGTVTDSDRNTLNVPGTKYDIEAMGKIRSAAHSMGITEGKPKFLSGHRRVTQSEWEDQMARAIDGEQFPDWYDPGYIDEAKKAYYRKKNGQSY